MLKIKLVEVPATKMTVYNLIIEDCNNRGISINDWCKEKGEYRTTVDRLKDNHKSMDKAIELYRKYFVK